MTRPTTRVMVTLGGKNRAASTQNTRPSPGWNGSDTLPASRVQWEQVARVLGSSAKWVGVLDKMLDCCSGCYKGC